jgi:hypothetical protein
MVGRVVPCLGILGRQILCQDMFFAKRIVFEYGKLNVQGTWHFSTSIAKIVILGDVKLVDFWSY